MTKKEIWQKIEETDDTVLFAIIECCKQFYLNGTPLYKWERDELLNVFDEAIDDLLQ